MVVAYYRGLITKGQGPSGGMAAIGLGAQEVSLFLSDEVVMACENSEESTTISGNRADLKKTLDSIRKVKPDKLVRMLKVDVAYHSCESPCFQKLTSCSYLHLSPCETFKHGLPTIDGTRIRE